MTITATQLKQQTYLLDYAIKEDIEVTKRDRSFVVIVEADRYKKLIANQKDAIDTNSKHSFDEALDGLSGIFDDIEEPAVWQKKIREESDRDVWRSALDEISH